MPNGLVLVLRGLGSLNTLRNANHHLDQEKIAWLTLAALVFCRWFWHQGRSGLLRNQCALLYWHRLDRATALPLVRRCDNVSVFASRAGQATLPQL